MTTTLRSLLAVFAQWVVIFYPGVLAFWLIVHNNIARLRPLGTRAFWMAAVAWSITSGPLLFFRKTIFSIRWAPPLMLRFFQLEIGIVCLCFGTGLYHMAHHEISLRTMIGFPELKPRENPQSMLHMGIYAKTRNPIYFGYWLIILSSAAFTNFAANWIMFGLNCIVLPLLIRAEERELLTRYGSDYADYMRRVPRFFPRLR